MEVSWTLFKSFVDGQSLFIHEVPISDGYVLEAYDGPIYRKCRIDGIGSTDVNDYENNYQGNNGKARQYRETVVSEEDIKTGGHYQAEGHEIDIDATTGWKILDVSYPYPVSMLAAEWTNKSENDGDELEFLVGPDTTIGAITADVAASATVIDVQQSVIDNISLGRCVKLDDGTNADDLGRVINVDNVSDKITVETATTNSFLSATPTYVKMTTQMLRPTKLSSTGRIQLGEAKIGGSYIPANVTLRARYNNISGTAKKFRFIVEYLY